MATATTRNSYSYTKTDSTFITKFGYDTRTQELHVEIKANGVTHDYVYMNVPQEVICTMKLRAYEKQSIGKFYNAFIKGVYPVR